MTNFDNFRASGVDKNSANSDIRFVKGELLAGKYEVISFLGRGGMSQVFGVKQVFLNKNLAMKVLDVTNRMSDIQIRRFQVEAKAAFSLNHANLVRVYDFGELETNEHYLVMDLIEGPSLSDYVKTAGPMKPEAAIPLFLQICDGLAYAHKQGIVHRDLKPNNIMLTAAADGDGFSAKIVDFGIAKVMSAEGGEIQSLTRTGEIFGSPLYMSPEQCSGDLIDYRSDIYSLGCTFFEALTGTPPHVGANALRTMMLHQATNAPLMSEASLGNQYPAWLESIVQRMLEKSPADRYQSVSEVVDDLLAGQEGRAKSSVRNAKIARVLPQNEQSVGNSRPKQLGAGLVVLAILAGIAGAGWLVYKQLDRKREAGVVAATPVPVKKERTLVDEVDGVFKFQHKQAAKSRDAFKRVASIEAVEFQSGNRLYKKIIFPDRSIGLVSSHVSFLSDDKSVQFVPFEAAGPRVVPAAASLKLSIGGATPDAIKDPSIIEKIHGPLFDELKITGCQIDLMIDDPSVKTVQDENIIRILQACKQWPTLTAITLANLSLQTKTIESLNQFEHLNYLGLDRVDGDFAFLAKQAFMNRLQMLFLTKVSINAVLSKMNSDSALTRMAVADAPDLMQSFKSLSRFRHLQTLGLGREKINDELIDSLCGMRRLKHLMLMDCSISLSQLKLLLAKSSPELKISLIGSSRDCLAKESKAPPRVDEIASPEDVSSDSKSLMEPSR